MLSSHQKPPNFSSDKVQLKRFGTVHRLRRAGMSIKGIGERLKMSRMTVYNYLRFEEFPERSRTRGRGGKLQPYLKYVHQRFAEGCQNATQLWREVVEQGSSGQTGDGSAICAKLTSAN